MKKLIVILILLSGCAHDGTRVQVDNPDFNVQFLFEKDGCKIYRFMDAGRYVYWTDCRGRMESSYQSGKSTIRFENETN